MFGQLHAKYCHLSHPYMLPVHVFSSCNKGIQNKFMMQ